MMPIHSTTKGKHLTQRDRELIENWLSLGYSENRIAGLLGKSRGCIQNEVKRGTVSLIGTKGGYYRYTTYSAQAGQRNYKKARQSCGRPSSLTQSLVDAIESLLLLHYSVTIVALKLGLAPSTLYTWINNGQLSLTREQALLYPQKQKKKERTVKKSRKFGNSIETRPEVITARERKGDFEIDTVVPKRAKGEVLLTLTDRKTRYEIIRKISGKTASAVNQAVEKLRQTYEILSLTSDNGSEFAQLTKLEGIEVYYTHPYSSWERGSNENQNRMIRRWFPKGEDQIREKEVAYVQKWINDHPRKMFNYKSSEMMFLGG